MIRRVPAVVVADSPEDALEGWFPDRVPVKPPLPSDPFDLGAHHLAWALDVDDAGAAQAALLAAVRNVALVIRSSLGGRARAEFLDQLARVANVCVQPSDADLSEEQTELLRLLGLGMSVGEAAAEIGLSRRTAHRRLVEARRALGVDTVIEAVLSARPRPGPGRHRR